MRGTEGDRKPISHDEVGSCGCVPQHLAGIKELPHFPAICIDLMDAIQIHTAESLSWPTFLISIHIRTTYTHLMSLFHPSGGSRHPLMSGTVRIGLSAFGGPTRCSSNKLLLTGEPWQRNII